MSFPTRGQIFQDRVDKIKSTVARPSLDTFYEVNFSFGKYQTWLGGETPGKRRTQGTDFMQKMKLMCTQAEIPGTSFVESSVTGHHQGITEAFPNLRNFPPLDLVFYADADHVILEVLESWMSYINPIFDSGIRDSNAFARFNYPEDYKETIHLTKFERDTFIRESRNASYQSNMTSYEFVNVWPIDLSSMRVAYGDSNVLRCNIKFAYDRFFTSFNYKDIKKQVVNNSAGIVNSNDAAVEGGYTFSDKNLSNAQLARVAETSYGDTVPPGSFGIGSKSTDGISRPKIEEVAEQKIIAK